MNVCPSGAHSGAPDTRRLSPTRLGTSSRARLLLVWGHDNPAQRRRRPGPAGLHRDPPPGRPLPPRQRRVDRLARHPGRPCRRRRHPPPVRHGGGEGPRHHHPRGPAGRRGGAEGRGPLRVLHGRGSRRGTGPLAARRRPRRDRRCGRPPGAGPRPGEAGALGRPRRPGRLCVRGREGSGHVRPLRPPERAGPAGRVLLPRGPARGGPRRVRRPPRPLRRSHGPGPADGPGCPADRPGRLRLRDASGWSPLGRRGDPRRAEDLQPHDPRRGRGDRRCLRPGCVAGRGGSGGRPARHHRRAQLPVRSGRGVAGDPAGRPPGVGDAGTGAVVRAVPERGGAAGELRLPRPHPVRRPAGARPVEARREPRRVAAGRGRGPHLRRAGVPALVEGRDRGAGGLPHRGVRLLDPHPRLDGRGDEGTRIGEAAALHPQGGLPRHVARVPGGDPCGRPGGQRPPVRRGGARPPGGSTGTVDRPDGVAHDAADRQRLLPPGHERDRVPRRDPPAPVLRPGGIRRAEPGRDRRGDRPRDRSRLR